MAAPELFVGTAGGNKVVTGMTVGTPSGTKNVLNAYVGVDGGSPRRFFQATGGLSVWGGAASHTQINLAWTDIDPKGKFVYHVYRGSAGLIALDPGVTSTYTSFSDTGLSPSTTYTYTIYAVRNGIIAAQASVAITTAAPPYVPPPPPPAPPPVPQPPPVYSAESVVFARSSASYYGNGTVRSDSYTNGGNLFYGYFDKTWGVNFCTWDLDVPSWVRGALSLRVFVRVRVNNTNANNAGGSSWAGLTLNHNGGQAQWGTETFKQCHTEGCIRSNGATHAWLNSGSQNQGPAMYGDGWIEVSDMVVPSRGIRIADEFRYHGATGFGLKAWEGDSTSAWRYGSVWGVNGGIPQWAWPGALFIGTYS